MIQGGDDTPERLFWRWQTRSNELTIDQLRVVRDWALLRFPGSIDLLELDIWKLQHPEPQRRRSSYRLKDEGVA